MRPSIDVPAIDLNYGVGDHIQLTLQTAPVLLKRSGHGLIGGLGETEAAVKWRFLDEETSGFDVSMFPRVIFNVVQSSVRRGLAEDGTRFQIPFQMAKTLRPMACGRRVRSVERALLVEANGYTGIVCGFDVAKPTMLMAELHDESRMNFTRDVADAEFRFAARVYRKLHPDCVDGPRASVPRSADRVDRLLRNAVPLLNRINALLKPAFAGRSGSMRRSPRRARAMRCNGSEPTRHSRSACRENRRRSLRADESK